MAIKVQKVLFPVSWFNMVRKVYLVPIWQKGGGLPIFPVVWKITGHPFRHPGW